MKIKIKLSKFQKILLNLVLGLIVIPSLAVSSIIYLNKQGFFNVDKIDISFEEAQKNEQYLRPLVKQLDAKMEMYRGKSLWSIELSDLKKDLAKFKWVEQYNLTKSWPSGIRIVVKPFEVKLLYLGKNGKFIPIVDDGKMLDPIDAGVAPDVAILAGDQFSTNSELRKKAVQVIDSIPKTGAFSHQTISEVRYDKKDGFWMSLVNQNIKIKMGEDDIASKSNRVSKVIEYMDAHEYEGKIIDANLSKKVLVKLKK